MGIPGGFARSAAINNSETVWFVRKRATSVAAAVHRCAARWVRRQRLMDGLEVRVRVVPVDARRVQMAPGNRGALART